jgi:hypothetical protein
LALAIRENASDERKQAAFRARHSVNFLWDQQFDPADARVIDMLERSMLDLSMATEGVTIGWMR